VESEQTVNETRLKFAGCLIIAAAAVAAYFPVFSNSFAWDDEYLVLKNPAIHDLSSIPGFFTDSWAGGVDYELGQAQNKPYFRPMALTSMTLDWAVAGPDPVVFHATNLMIHIVAAWCLFLWLLKVFSDTPRNASGTFRRIPTPVLAAFVGAIGWAVHPVSTEAVNLVSYRTSLISGLTIFAGLMLLTPRSRADEPGRSGIAAVIGATLLYAVGLLSKETTLVMPGLLFVMDIAAGRLRFRQKGEKGRRLLSGPTAMRIARVYVPLAIVAIVWLGLRSRFTGEGVYTYFDGLTFGQSILMFGRIFYLYVRLAVAPWPLCPFYDWGILGVPKSILEPDIAAGFILFALIFGGAVRFVRRNVLASAGLFFFLVALLPVSHIIPFFDAAGDRFMYVPLAGLALAAGGAAISSNSARRFQVPLKIVSFLVIAVFMLLSAARSAQWKDSETMLRVTTRDFPTSISAHLGLGRLLLEKSRPTEAVVPLKHVTDIAPNLAIGHALLAVAHARNGDIAAARLTLRNSPMPPSGEVSAIQLARSELIKSGNERLAMRLGLMSP